GGELQWSLVILGALIAVTLELAGVPALPVAVGMYIPLSATTPIFVGGLLRWLTDRLRGASASESEAETSPGVLMASGYIAGGTLCGLIIVFFVFLPEWFNKALELGKYVSAEWLTPEAEGPKLLALIMFAVLALVLIVVGSRKAAPPGGTAEGPNDL